MNIDEVMLSQFDDGGAEKCAVCGKPVSGARGYARLKYEDSMVELCCPLCLETFQKDPQHSIHRQATKREVHAIFDLLRPTSAG